MKPFTVEAGIEVQAQDLKRWKRILKSSVYDKLEAYALKDNHKAKDGYQIARGIDLSNYVQNLSRLSSHI
jgi:hypothetical protein